MHVVAALVGRDTLTWEHAARGREAAVQRSLPVGIKHAVADPFPQGGGRPVALCGADIHDWLIFADATFETGDAAACQRCGQLVISALDARLPLRLVSDRPATGKATLA
jgi:hypothetical protein